MSSSRFPLEQFSIPVPCTVSWASMSGDDRVRSCGQCQQKVYHLSAMSRREAEALLADRNGRACVRLYRRPDGTVLTRDCRAAFRPIALAAAAGLWAAALFVILLAWLVTFVRDPGSNGVRRMSDVEPFRTLLSWFNPSPPQIIMGEVCPVPPEGGDGQGEEVPPDERGTEGSPG